jgi:hypothetical protein
MRAVAALLAGSVCVLVALAVIASGSFFGRGSRTQDDSNLETLKSLQDEMNKKDVALAFLEKRLKETQEGASSSAAIHPKNPTGPTAKAVVQETESDAQDSGPLTALEDSLKPRKPTPSRTLSRDSGGTTTSGLSTDSSSPDAVTSEAEASFQTELNENAGKTPILNFDAKEVTAASEGPNSGTLNFRLIKDQPDIRFSGYLFVVVEMADQRGENKTYVYPKDTLLGEEDLPSDYKKGEGISFKENARVELPYEDLRVGVGLSRVSIVLYAENGRIVFQRSFEKKEVKLTTARNAHAESTGGRHKAGEKRRAL